MTRENIKKFLDTLNIKYTEWGDGSIDIKIGKGSVIGDEWAGVMFYFDENGNYKELYITGD